MARNKKHTKTDPSAMTARVMVVEWREKLRNGNGKWKINEVFTGESRFREMPVICSVMAETITSHEFRYRAATLTFDDDGSRCVIY